MMSDQMEACTLADCPPGLFLFGETLCFRSEYSTTVKVPPYVQPDAYVVESGEYFWGGAKTSVERSALMVHPCDAITPADIDAAVQAEREACATQLDMMRKAHNDALIGQPHTPDTSIAYGNGAAAIRARGPTPALAEALAQARREGMEEERKAWATMWARHRNPVAFSEAMQKHIAIRSSAAGEEGK